MEKIEWTQDLETNIDIIDKQHHDIINLINEFPYKNKAKPFEEKKKILNILDDYTTLHFRLEEYYALRYNFPDRINLINEHELFKNIYSSFRYYYISEENFSAILEHLDFVIIKQLKTHIITTDKELALFLKKNNVHVI